MVKLEDYYEPGIVAEKDAIVMTDKPACHKSFEERLAEYGGEITVCDFDWGEPKGREIL